MSTRLRLADLLLRLGEFIQSSAVVVMKPDDLVQFSRRSYANPQSVEAWVTDDLVDAGLTADELDLLADVPIRSGNLLVLGVGGGREAVPLSRLGFNVTGLDYVPEMVDRARENAARRGVSIEGLVQEISCLEVPAGAFDVVWLSAAMYSCVPTRARRVAMVRRIAHGLKPGGFLICQFFWRVHPKPPRRVSLARRAIARLVGNPGYEDGDTLWANVEFIHDFSVEAALQSEFESGGLEVVRLHLGGTPMRSGAVCRKPLAATPVAGPREASA